MPCRVLCCCSVRDFHPVDFITAGFGVGRTHRIERGDMEIGAVLFRIDAFLENCSFILQLSNFLPLCAEHPPRR